MERPDRLIARLRGGCDLSIQEEFELYLYIKYLETEVNGNKEQYNNLLKIVENFNKD